VCAGGAVMDRKFHLAAPSVAGTSNPAEVSTSSGGVARNVAENLAGLLAGYDVQVDLVSAIGDDDAGATLLAHLRERRVGTGSVRIHPGESTAQYVAVLEPGGDLVIGIAAMAVLDRVGEADLETAWPEDGWVFCDTNLAAPVLAGALRLAREQATPLAVDAVSTVKVIRLPAELTGIALLSCNRDEARAWLAGHQQEVAGSDTELAARLQAAGAAAVLLTRGAEGVVLADRNGVRELPAVPAEVVDVTGAGDALVAGALAALIIAEPRHDLESAARAGIELAARTVASDHSVLPPAPAADPHMEPGLEPGLESGLEPGLDPAAMVNAARLRQLLQAADLFAPTYPTTDPNGTT
jgi:pseudouridine kinase